MRRCALIFFLSASLGALASGCYCSHERLPSGDDDAGVRRDAPDSSLVDPPRDAGPAFDGGPGPDAGPAGDIVWVPIEGTGAELFVERCELREGQTPIFRVRVVANACDEPGNTRWSVDHAARTVTLDPFVWRPVGGPPCPPATIEIVRDVALLGESLAEGAWTVVFADGTHATPFTVQRGPPELTCTDCLEPGATCLIDMECVGERTCVPIRGDAVCISVCAAPCQPFPETSDGSASVSDLWCSARFGSAATCGQDPSFGWLCEAATRDLCPPCTAGTGCRSDGDFTSYCAWDLSPWDAGGACNGDRDCLPGISCVEIAGLRSCQVRCRSDHPCPFGACGPTRQVCEIPKI